MTKINTGDLDFAKIKENLKTFLSSQSELTDYDFDGSIMSTIIDVLAANTHYNALYTNMAINEMFIDSASKRSSISSIAKLLGYTPKSVKSSTASLNIVVTTTDNHDVITMPAGTTFSTSINGSNFIFNLLEDKTVSKYATNEFRFNELKVVEGTSSSVTYTKSTNTKFVIPDPNADITSISVKVNGITFNYAKTMLSVKSTDNVYYIKQIDDGVYEVYFGDGVFGTAVQNGSVVSIKYIVSSGSSANFASVFSYSGGFNSNYSYYVTSAIASYGGAEKESKESIRYFAPLYHQSQGRAVTASDYAAIISETYPEIETISVWGGQDNIPPQFGKVFIAAKPIGRDNFTDMEKSLLKKGIASKKGVVSITPVFVDPKYYDIDLNVSVYYDQSKTSATTGAISTEVLNVINSYNNTITSFDKTYRHSVLMNEISNVDSSIVSVIGTHRIRTTIQPYVGVLSDYSIDLQNPIAKNDSSTFYTTRFYLSDYTQRGYFKNIGTDIYFFTEDVSGTPTQQRKYGTIDFAGKISLDKINITGLYDDLFEFVFYPLSYDVIPKNGYITRIPTKYRTVNILVDSVSRNNKADHVFTPSK